MRLKDVDVDDWSGGDGEKWVSDRGGDVENEAGESSERAKLKRLTEVRNTDEATNETRHKGRCGCKRLYGW